jgi:hypothetical protein
MPTRVGPRHWAMPLRPIVGLSISKELIPPRLDASGRPVYRASIEFRNRRIAERFNAAVLDALRREHPHALAGQASS